MQQMVQIKLVFEHVIQTKQNTSELTKKSWLVN